MSTPVEEIPTEPISNEHNEATLTPRRRRTFWGWVWRVLWITVVGLIALSLLLVLLYRFINPPLTPLMVQRFCQQVTTPDRPVNFERHYVSIDNISPNLVKAVVASEDGNFMHHHGFDIKMLKQSYRENQQGRRIRGGSTISMQTAKNAFLPHHRSLLRKAVEAYFTQLIEWTWGKKRIMECYLNIIEFGDGIYGCEAAAQHYFGHSAKTLSATEAAQLAVTLPAPLKRNPGHPTPYFRKQTNIVVNRMQRYGNINLDAQKKYRQQERQRKREGKTTNKRHKEDETLFDFVKWVIQQKKH